MGTMTAGTHAPVASPERFETVYAEAMGDAARIPWAEGRPHPALIMWLNAVATSLIRCGGRVCVVGCGLGDDARELMRRGYEVLTFDCSPTAIRWAQSLDPENASSYIVADLFEPPARWQHRFDLVVEINTLQSLVPEQRGEAMRSIAGLLSRHGHLLVICRAAEKPVPVDAEPPWAITPEELRDMAREADLVETEPMAVFEDDEIPPVRRIRAVYHRRA